MTERTDLSVPKPLMRRRQFLRGALGAGGIAAAAGLAIPGTALGATRSAGRQTVPGLRLPPDRVVAADVRREFLHVWDGYKKFAWGHDQLLPLSGSYAEFFVPGHPIGLSIIEALDTLYVMELDDELALGVNWVKQNLDFDIDGNFHVFEFIIRVVGGLLAGYLATGDEGLLDLAAQSGDLVLPAFTQSPTGMPYQYVNFRTGALSGATPPIAEIGTNILEFGVLSRLTGDRRYYKAAKNAYRAVVERRSSLDLLASYLNVETGQWADSTDQAPNPPDDSFYEYLWGGWAMFADADCLAWYRMFTTAFKKHLIETYDGHTWFKQVNFETGALVGRDQSELAAFYGEVLAHGGDIALGQAYYRTWVHVAEKYPVLPEEIDYTTLAALSKGNQLRPEYLNAAFDLWVQLRRDIYKTTSYAYFQNMKTYNRVPNGYTIIDDVTVRPMVLGDLFPAYSFAENFKYLWLIFSRTPRYDYRTGYLSTEGKILRGLRPAR
ncbi:MAG: glycoside hydrolase family 47 protein [Streptosporangiaceae bacterium]|nr:glycoside hydrolase family 47 protein [Streptosporangiaceae bacterium]MBV9854972.1 glycoside hydrolase family 47 protein [Streptosporangiaceae bacterium]